MMKNALSFDAQQISGLVHLNTVKYRLTEMILSPEQQGTIKEILIATDKVLFLTKHY